MGSNGWEIRDMADRARARRRTNRKSPVVDGIFIGRDGGKLKLKLFSKRTPLLMPV